MGNVSNFPNYNLGDIPSALRLLANKIESGDIEARRCIVTLEEPDGLVDYRAFGDDFTTAHAMGILFANITYIQNS